MPQSQHTTTPVQHSEEVHEIFTRMPGWMIRWGITVLFAVVVLLVALSAFIRYPDVIEAKVTLQSEHPPVSLVSRAGGAVELFVEDNLEVAVGQTVALLKSAADYDNILALKNKLPSLPQLRELNEFWKLGELQPYYNHLIISLKRSKNLESTAFQNINRKILIRQQIRQQEGALENQQSKIALLQSEYDAAQQLMTTRYQPLRDAQAISQQEFELYETESLRKRRDLETAKAAVADYQNLLLMMKKELQELDYLYTNETVNFQNDIEDAYTQLLTQIGLWEEKYLLKAPVAGRLIYLEFLKNDVFVQPEQELAKVIPAEGGEVFGQLFLPQSGAGKVDTGQVVLLELDDYPKGEFGMVEGKVASIATVAQEKGYKVSVALPQSLTTTAQKTLQFKHGMTGRARVVTKDISLLHRFFYQVRGVWG